ncbi:hypothetical protein ASF21_05590 [Arthrobacter sp. Leaf234]|uniref:hypothetical protein n=1 Tax=Arthrobacter sp. Leaf234 TaxID=1736303 RepID=UPI0006FE9F55|nr:hypothetical protein [Arthrobacter sp. Leaf234]KQO03718.1 hypothetical protein ASF21_05590 [Arthrobacter sp. Leaf234]
MARRTAIDRGGHAAVAMAIHATSGHVNRPGLTISGWTGADQDVSITKGDTVNASGLASGGLHGVGGDSGEHQGDCRSGIGRGRSVRGGSSVTWSLFQGYSLPGSPRDQQ